MKLKQLAEHLSLSQTTVSRALNGYPEVSEKTRKRVQQVAEELGYVPSHQARNLATGRSYTIGHIVPMASHQMINPHFADFFHGACRAYRLAGYDSLVRMVTPETEEASYKELVKTRRVDGFVIHGPRVDDFRIEFLQKLGVPFVVHGRCVNKPEKQYSWLDVDNVESFRNAAEYLIQLGHKKIGLINGPEWMTFARQRREGYEQSFKAHKLTLDENWLYAGDMTEPLGYQAMQEMYDLEQFPTAVLCAGILPAFGVQRALHEKGLKMGRDFSLVVFDDQLSFIPNSGQTPMFTSVRSSISEAGFAVANMLIKSIEHPELEPTQQLWQAEFIKGESTCPPYQR